MGKTARKTKTAGPPAGPLMPGRPAVPIKPDKPGPGAPRSDGPRSKSVNLALQGGGSHGAFTWGVLDRLLEDDRVVIEGISGTSAGAMNAAVMAQGMARHGREGAREALAQFWHRVADLALFSPVRRTPLEVATGQWNIDRSPLTAVLDVVQNMFSPYQTNPLGLNPLHDLLAELIDEKDIQSTDHFKIFVCATNVQTGRPRVFHRHELTVDAVMASATLPFTFQATEIDGVPYWDGGYMGNPVIWPLVYFCKSADVVLVQINPRTIARWVARCADGKLRVVELLIAANPDPDSRLAYLMRLPLGDGMVFRTSGTWPRTKALYCYPVAVDEWPADRDVVERVRLRS